MGVGELENGILDLESITDYFIGVENVRKHNSLYIASFYSNLCTESLYLAIIRSYTVHQERKILHSLKIDRIIPKIGLNQKCPEFS